MSRLPNPGSDEGQWGDLLNDYLSQSHTSTGTLKPSAVIGAGAYSKPTDGIPEGDLEQDVQDKLNAATSGIADGSITTAKIDPTGLDPDVITGTALIMSSVGAISGVAGLDGAKLVQAANSRPYNWRGYAQPNTTYNRWDVVIYYGRRILITATTFTTGSASRVFISGGNYTDLGPIAQYNAYDYGYRADGNAATGPSNTAALKAVIIDANANGGGEVYIPAGYAFVNKDGSNPWAIELLSFVSLVGAGMRSTEIVLNAAQNCTLIKAHTSTGSGNSNACFTGLRNMRINGNKDNQSAGSWHGVDFTTNPQYTAQTGDQSFDMHHHMENVQIYKAKGNGLHTFGRSASVFHNVHMWANDGHGYYGTFDTKLSDCQAEGNGLSGFYRVGEMTNCKSFLNGTVDPAQGHGFVFTSGGSAVCCFTQNNKGYGALFDGCNGSSFIAGGADTNNNNAIGGTNGGGNYAGIGFINNASNNIVEANCSQADQAGAGFIGAQLSAVSLTSGCTGNYIVVTHKVTGTLSSSAGPVIQAGSVTTGNTIVGNGVSLTAKLGDPTDVAIANPTDGQALVYDQASGKWKNGSPGAGSNFSVGVFGDGSDGQIVYDGTTNIARSTRSGTVYTLTADVFATNVTINSGVTVKSNGYRFFCTGSWVNNGSVTNDGNDASGFAGGAQTTGSTTAAGTAGGTGNTLSAGAVNANSGAVQGVGAGGAGGVGASGTGAVGGTVYNTSAANLRTVIYAISGVAMQGTVKLIGGAPGGGAGGGDSTNKGGGGGGGGGAIVVIARSATNTGAISAKGGKGGDSTGGNAGAGGGGGGGIIVLYTISAWSNTGTTVVTGGAGGAGQGTGGAGVSGGNGSVTNFIIQ